MNNYINPQVVLLPSASGIDAEIQNIQAKLGSLGWLEKVFGRCFVQKELVSPDEGVERMGALYGNFKREIIYPEVYAGPNNEPLNVMPNDNLKSYCFFHVKDPIRLTEYDSFGASNTHQANVSIIFWMNLKKVDPTKKWRFTEELKLAAINQLKLYPNITVEQTFESYDRVFEGFILTEAYRQYLKPPYSGFRLECELTFSENC